MDNSQTSKSIETLLTDVKEMWDNKETPHAQIIGYMEGYLKTLKKELDQEIEYEYIGECKGNDGNGCFMDSPGHDCGCFVKIVKKLN
jgi:hypothetical protein